MTLGDSFPKLQDLQRFAAAWCKENIEVTSLAEAEKIVQSLGRVVNQAMIEATMGNVAGKTTYEGTSIDCECGQRARFVNYRPRFVQTLVGGVTVMRAYYHCGACHKGYLAWDVREGLNECDWSPGVKGMACEVCGRLHYREAAALIDRLAGLKIEESSLEEIVREVGGRLRAREDERTKEHFQDGRVVTSEEKPGRFYIAMDAARAHIDGDWHDVKVGVLYQGERSGRGKHPERDRKVGGLYRARREASVEFGKRIYAEAAERGLHNATEVVVLGDGADWIWIEADLHFGAFHYIGIVDYWHACEHIHKLAKVLYGEDSTQGERWAKDHCATLEAKGPDNFIRAMKRRKPKTEKQKEAVRKELGYFQRNRKRMDYPAFNAKGLMIGSGPVEAGCKVVVGARMKGSGMRWSDAGADAILSVRTAVLNGDYEEIACAARAA